jgi:isopentenyl diphosphate isomerase/L-lactate dehydrogenase-like FMN-dependent dehydrogenase
MSLTSRRAFLEFLAATPLAAAFPGIAGADDSAAWMYRDLPGPGELDIDLPQRLEDVAGVLELEKLAELVLPPAHFGYIHWGEGNGESKLANRNAYLRYAVVPRRLQGLGEVDPSIELFGRRYSSPLFMSPVNGHKAFHPGGEIATAEGARRADAIQMLSSLSNTAVEKVVEARGEGVWYQLYPTNDEKARFEVVRRAEAAGCPAIVMTVDDIGDRRSEIAEPYFRRDTRDCSVCHQRSEPGDFLKRKPMLEKYRLQPDFDIMQKDLDFDDVKRLRGIVKGKLLIKGIMHPQDAADCLAAGVDGIVVSNHGGRVESGGVGTLDALPEIAREVQGKMAILLDGGIRRGTDVFKALALGADAVGFARPYLWGLAAYGASGVALANSLIAAELKQAMLHAGCANIDEISTDQLSKS